jgi:hypothetical protein
MIGTGAGVLAGLTKPTEKQMTDCFSMTMLKGTDIGPLIPHIGPPSVTLPVEMLFSSSKSHFSSSRYQAAGQQVSCALLVYVNPNLNCGTPCPTPTGMVAAITTHMVDMTWGDVFAGLLAMAADALIQFLLNKLGSFLGGKLSSFLSEKLFDGFMVKFLGEALQGGGDVVLAEMWAGVMAAAKSEKIGNIAGAVASTVFGFLVGGPMGADIGSFGGYGKDADGNAITPGGTGSSKVEDFAEGLGQKAGKALDNYLDGPPKGDFPLPSPGAAQPV